MRHNLPESQEVLDILNKIRKKIAVILTGRFGTKRLERADFVNELKDVKHLKIILTPGGIQY